MSPALVIGILIAAMSVQPVLGDHEAGGHTGTVGFHALLDTNASPGADCKYRQSSLWGVDILRRITVKPPRMRAVAGSQKVSWQFTVQRRESFEGATTSWYATYTSPAQAVTTNSTTDASFAPMGVRVIGAYDGPYSYRVLIKMKWLRPNGNTQGTATRKVDHYRLILDADEGRNKWRCSGAI